MPMMMPPEQQPMFQPSPQTGQDAMMGLMPGQMGGMNQAQPPVQDTGRGRSALAFLDAAQELLQAASDNLPELGPAINQATNIIAQALQNISSQGSGAPVGYPPQQAQPPGQSPMMTGGGGFMGSGPEDIPLTL